MDDFKKMWEEWNLGGKIIFVSACISTISMFMTWVDVGLASQSGLSQGAFLMLGLYVYPMMMLFKNNNINKLYGRICSGGAVLFVIIYISSKTISMFGKSVNVSSTGAYIFLLASIAFIIGVEKYSVGGTENIDD